MVDFKEMSQVEIAKYISEQITKTLDKYIGNANDTESTRICIKADMVHLLARLTGVSPQDFDFKLVPGPNDPTVIKIRPNNLFTFLTLIGIIVDPSEVGNVFTYEHITYTWLGDDIDVRVDTIPHVDVTVSIDEIHKTDTKQSTNKTLAALIISTFVCAALTLFAFFYLRGSWR